MRTPDHRDPREPAEAADSAVASGPGDEVRGVEIPLDSVSAEALRGLVEEFVSREGTDYGHSFHSLEAKVAAVLHQLEAGEARIVFDLDAESASIVSTRERS